MKTCMRTINAAMVAIVLVASAAAQDSKCPVGLKYVGRLHYETNADNGHETKAEVTLGAILRMQMFLGGSI
jgi:hypothetical protein